MADKPQLLGYTALLGDTAPKVPTRWERVKQALWETNLNAPIRGFYNLMNADPYTLYTDTGEAGQQAVADSFDAAGGITVGSMPIPKPANSLSMGIKAYHGSPHSFDKFSMDKIGTGEGAQAYGHGLYFAENEGVAKGYRDTLKPGKGTGPEDTASRVLDGHGGDREAAIASLTDTIDRAFANNAPYEEVQRLMQAKNILNTAPEKASGSMYEVEINADPDAFLDWDKPMSEQPPNVQAVLGSGNDIAATRLGNAYKNEMFGGDIVGKDRATPSEVSRALADKGIPGIKYLDAGSRGAGDGTRNYVVFDDKLISIVRKYGIAGASAMLGYSVMDGVSKSQAAELEKANAQYHGSNMRSGGW